MSIPPLYCHSRYDTVYRASLAEDEPRCEQLRQQKEELKQSLLKYHSLQSELIEAVKTLKLERASLMERKVRNTSYEMLS